MKKNKKLIPLILTILFLFCFMSVCFYNYQNVKNNLNELTNEKIIKEELKKDEKLKGFILAWYTMKKDYYSHIDSNELLNRSLNALHDKEDVSYVRLNNFYGDYTDFLTGIKFIREDKTGRHFIAQIDDNLKEYKNKYNLYYGREVFKVNNKDIDNIYGEDKRKITLSKEYSLTLKNNKGQLFDIKLPNYNKDNNSTILELEKSNWIRKDIVYEKDNTLIINTGKFNSFFESSLNEINEKIKQNKSYKDYILDFRKNSGGSLYYEKLLSCILGTSNIKSTGLNEAGIRKTIPLDIEYMQEISEECNKYKTIKDYFKDKKFIVWMDEESASATEALISSLILSDKVRFTVGARTYGKGVAQSNVRLPGYYSKRFYYTSHILVVNGIYTNQLYGIEPNIEIEFKGKEIKRMEDYGNYISPPEYLKKIPVKRYKEYVYDKKDLDKYDEIYYNATKDNLNLQI